MTFIPFIPPTINHVPQNVEPDLCPKCHKEECIIEVCANCGYEYERKDDSISTFEGWVFAFIVITSIWVFITIFKFLCDLSMDEKPTSLLHHFIAQFNFIWYAIKHII